MIRYGRRCAAAERDALLAALDGKRVSTGTGGRAAARPPRRAADRAQSVHRRSAPPADADRDGARAARRRRCDPALPPDPWRDAALAGDRSLGQRHAQDRRRGDRARARADGLPPDLGRCDGPRHRHRGAAARRDGPAARRCDLAHLRAVPRLVSGADRAARRRRAAGRGARRRRRGESARRCARAARRRKARAHLRHRARRLRRGRRGAARAGRERRAAIGAAYLAATSHGYGGAEGEGTALPGAFAAQVATADLLLHGSDDPSRDLLEGAEDVAHIGGFAAAAASLGREADLVVLDTTDPNRPARGHSTRRWPGSCAAAPSIRASSRA